MLIGCAFLIKDTFFRPEPDYRIGYVSKTALPEEVLDDLRSRLEGLGEDVNGDGRVMVELLTYIIGFDDASMLDVNVTSAGITRLTVDLPAGRVYVLLLDDPEGFQGHIGALSYLDGTVLLDNHAHGAVDWTEMVYAWDDCPVLAIIYSVSIRKPRHFRILPRPHHPHHQNETQRAAYRP